MSEAEDKFTEVVRLAMVSALDAADAEMTDSLFESLAQSVVGSLKMDEWFIHSEVIHVLEEADWTDWEDGSILYHTWVSDESGEDDE